MMLTVFFKQIHSTDDFVQQHVLIAKDIKSYEQLHKFITTHCTVTKYTFQIKKCSQMDCRHPFLPSDLFDSVHPLPSRMLANNSDKYKKFKDIYGTLTTEKDRPSLKATGNKALDEPIKHILNASKVRGVITCGECLRPVAVRLSITCECPMDRGVAGKTTLVGQYVARKARHKIFLQ